MSYQLIWASCTTWTSYNERFQNGKTSLRARRSASFCGTLLTIAARSLKVVLAP
jgi:hypothetical protein